MSQKDCGEFSTQLTSLQDELFTKLPIFLSDIHVLFISKKHKLIIHLLYTFFHIFIFFKYNRKSSEMIQGHTAR